MRVCVVCVIGYTQEWEREVTRTCAICLEDGSLAQGLECTDSSAAHFVCNPCLARHVSTESAADLRQLTPRNARVFCPMRRGAGLLGCASCEYSDGDLAAHLRSDPGVFADYIQARRLLLQVCARL